MKYILLYLLCSFLSISLIHTAYNDRTQKARILFRVDDAITVDKEITVPSFPYFVALCTKKNRLGLARYYLINGIKVARSLASSESSWFDNVDFYILNKTNDSSNKKVSVPIAHGFYNAKWLRFDMKRNMGDKNAERCLPPPQADDRFRAFFYSQLGKTFYDTRDFDKALSCYWLSNYYGDEENTHMFYAAQSNKCMSEVQRYQDALHNGKEEAILDIILTYERYGLLTLAIHEAERIVKAGGIESEAAKPLLVNLYMQKKEYSYAYKTLNSIQNKKLREETSRTFIKPYINS